MNKTHIAFVSFPHTPHVNPTLPIVSELVRRGYRVSYVTSGRFAERLSHAGAEIVLCPEFSLSQSSSDDADSPDGGLRILFDWALRTISSITPFYTHKPNLIVYDFMAVAGRIVASRWGVPAIQTSPVFALDREYLAQQVPDRAFLNSKLHAGGGIDRFLAEHGIADGNFVFHRERLNIYLFPKHLQPPGTVFGANCFYAGRCPGEQPYYGDWQPSKAEGRPICLVSTSTTYIRGPAYFTMCIEALRDLQWHVVLSIGETGDPASLLPLPSHFEIVQHTAHVKILPHTSLFICLGGIITQSEAMYHGVPLIILSHGFPELEWQADNFVRLGLGMHLRHADTNANSLRECAIKISQDATILTNVRKARRVVQRESGGIETANRIEDVLDELRLRGAT